MKTGDIVQWNEYLGFVVNGQYRREPICGWTCLVYWADGGFSNMYKDELAVISESR